MYSVLSTLNTTTEVPLSKVPNPQLLPGRRNINGCPLLQVCVYDVCSLLCVCTLDGLNVEHKFEYGSPYLVVRHFHFTNIHQHCVVVMKKLKRTPVATCEALVNSMPKRVEAVLENNGGHTKY